MRHVYFRGILAVIWLAAAIISGISGNVAMAVFYIILGGVFLYSAYRAREREKSSRGDE